MVVAQTTQPVSTDMTLLPVPEEGTRAKAREMIRSVLKAEYAKTSVADRLALAKRLIGEAEAVRTDDAARYVLLTEAVEFAVVGGDVGVVVQAIGELENLYEVDGVEMTRAAVVRMAVKNLSTEAAEALSRVCLDTAEAASVADQFETVTQLANLAETTAHQSRSVAYAASIQVRLADLRALATEFPQVLQAKAILEKYPNHAASHQVIGQFYALHKGQWALGLRHLAEGTDEAMRRAAAKELANPSDAIDQLAIGDAWWEIAGKSTGVARMQMTRHARMWYQRCRPALAETAMSRIQARLQEETSVPMVPVAKAVIAADAVEGGKTVDLLALIDPAKDKGEGEWAMEGKNLVVGSGRYSVLALPYQLPVEYELRVDFTRVEGTGAVCALLASHNKSFGFQLDVKGEARFERVAGKIAKDNPTSVPVVITNGKRHTLSLQIRNDSVQASLDGKLVTQWKTDYKDMSRYVLWKTPNDKLCGLGANNAKVIFHKVELVEISGAGKPVR